MKIVPSEMKYLIKPDICYFIYNKRQLLFRNTIQQLNSSRKVLGELILQMQ
jgi:hypothetical protein